MSSSLSPLAGIPLQEMNERRRDLVRAMSGGQLSVRYADGTSITYRSMAEMKIALNELEGRILAASAASNPLAPKPVRAIRLIPFGGYR
jgi:hypothetical protein